MYKNKFLERLFIGLVLLLFLALAGLEIFARLYRERAGVYLRDQFSQQSELVLQPFETSVSVWRHFPRITFSFNQISIIDTTGQRAVEVLSVKRASAAISLAHFRPGRLKISRLDLEDLVFSEQVDSNGIKAGLRFRKKENLDTTAGKVPFVIPVITIENGQVKSINKFKKSGYAFNVAEAKLAARFQDGKLNLTGLAEGKIGHFSNSRISFLRNKPFTLNLVYNYFPNQKKGYLKKSFAVINQDSIFINGSHRRLPEGQGSEMDLSLNGRQPLLYIFRQLLPAPAQPFLKRITTNSRMQFTYRITGISGPKQTPRNQIAFALQNGNFQVSTSSKRIIRDVNLTGNMDNGEGHSPETSNFQITNLTARTNEGQMQLQLGVDNFLKPTLTIKGEGRISLPELTGLMHLPFTRVGQGSITGSFDFTGKLPDTLRTSTPDWQGQGAVRVQKANFRVVGLKVNCQDVNGELNFTGNLLKLQNLSGKLGKQPFNLQASVRNYLAYLFQTPGNITAQADVYAAHLDTDWLDLDGLAGDKTSKSPSKQKKPATDQNATATRETLDNLRRARSEINLKVANVNLPGQEQLKNLNVQVNQNGLQVKLTHMRFTTNGGGQANANGQFVLAEAGIKNPELNVKLHYPFINLQQFMLDLATLQSNEQKSPAVAAADRPVNKPKNNFLKELNYKLTLQLTAARLEYLYLKGADLNLQANLTPHRARLTKLRVSAFGGQLDARGEMQLDAPGDNLPVKLRAQVGNVNLQRVFLLAENMKLDVLGSENIRGIANCNLNVTTTLDKTFSPSFAGTMAYAQAQFKNMELINVAPLQHALRFLRDERTKHLYFEEVNTSFIMKDNHFITPGLPLNSNLTNIDMSGTYTMGGGANLNVDINVFNVLFGNNKRRIEKIQSDSLALNTQRRQQHLLIFREQDKYKVKLSNRREREKSGLALRQEFAQYLRQHQIDTVFTLQN